MDVDILIKEQIIKKENIQVETILQLRHLYSVDSSVREEEEGDGHIFVSFLTLRNSAMLEKYFWFASATFFSAACGFTISSPCGTHAR